MQGFFSLRCRCARYPLIWSAVISLSWKRVATCHKCLVDIAAGFRGLVYSIAPVQKMRYGMTIDPFGIESNGLELKGLRRCGNGFLGGDGQCLVHVGSSLSVGLVK